ncbi:type I-E CRISPR-associated endoribonuclease Cas2e [Anaerococcus sp.]|uniref:type I-E CRISPR-associated endoribonuclease Cas2e n=1 Tax=Anaerococcus sp. TaxID=1872515 RepID=UPI00257E0CC5|nr:type I-E CRISPR-associated endoribonuclease Cas2e [Anaerococcus sp.]MBS6105792.1 type I-E CRISPR-associated endoribonuclease Cas2 [Anaerococcus sp.]
MPFTVITLKKTPSSLRGDLTKWMQEIDTGVYIGNFNSKVREELWKRVIENVKEGEATICYASRNEIGYDFKTNSKDISIIDFDGIPLVMVDKKEKIKVNDQTKLGYSRVAKLRKARQFQKQTKKSPSYVVIDIETDGLDFNKNSIIEIGCVKLYNGNLEEFATSIKIDHSLPKKIVNLTGITDEFLEKNGEDEKEALIELLDFIKELTIVNYGNNFDINFLNKSLNEHNLGHIKNQTIDLMRYVKKEKIMLENYKLETALKSYGIDKKVPHRALADARLTYELSTKVNFFKEKIKKDG